MNIPEELKNIYRNDRFPLSQTIAPKELYAEFPSLGLTVDTDQFAEDKGEFELNDSICSDGSLKFGKCNSAQVKFTLANVTDDIKGKEFNLTQTVNDTYTMPLGVFSVESCPKQDDLIFKDITAYDRMKKIDTDVAAWYNGLFPTGTEKYTLAQFRASFLAYVGLVEDTVTLPLPNDSMIVDKTIDTISLAGRTVIEAIGELGGVFGHISPEGKFEHIVLVPGYGDYPQNDYPQNDYPISTDDTTFVDPDFIKETITTDMRESVRFEEYTVKEIDKLIIRTDDDDIGAIAGNTIGPVVDTQTGTSIKSTKSDDSSVEITKIEGASSQVQTMQGKNLFDISKYNQQSDYDGVNVYRYRLTNLSSKKRYAYRVELKSGGTAQTGLYFSITQGSPNPNTAAAAGGFGMQIIVNGAVRIGYISALSTDLPVYLSYYPPALDPALIEANYDIMLEQLDAGDASTFEPFVPNSPSPEYPSPIISASNFNITASNGSDSNSVNISYELGEINSIKSSVERLNGATKYVKRAGTISLTGAETYIADTVTARSLSNYIYLTPTGFKANTAVRCSHLKYKSNGRTIDGDNNISTTTVVCFNVMNTLTGVVAGEDKASYIAKIKAWIAAQYAAGTPIIVQYEITTPAETVIGDISMTSYKGATSITTDSNPQVNITAKFRGDNQNTYIIQNNFLVYGKSAAELNLIANRAFGYMARRPYRPFESSGIGLPYLKVGDVIKHDQADPVVSYMLKRTLTGIQALKDVIGSSGSEKVTQTTTVNDEIKQIKAKATRITKTVDGVKVEVSDLAESTSAQFEIAYNDIALKVNKANIVQEVNLSTEGLKIDVTKLDINGIVTANGYFKIHLDGSMEAVNGKFKGSITSEGQYGTVFISDGLILGGMAQVDVVYAPTVTVTGILTAGQISLTASSGIVSCTQLNTQNINGYTPITSGNIAQQQVNYASTAGHSATSSNSDNTFNVINGGCVGNFIVSSGGGYISYSGAAKDNTSGYVYIGAQTVQAATIQQISLRKSKDHIDLYNKDALGLICNTPIRQYTLKGNQEDTKTHVGIIIDEAPEDAIGCGGKTVSLYDMISMSWKAIQQLNERISSSKE